MLIGVDMGGTKCAAVAIHDDGTVVAEAVRPTPVGGDAIVSTIVDVVRDVRAQAAVRAGEAADGGAVAIGVGVPGLVTPEGVLRFAPHLFGVLEVPLADILRAALGTTRVVVENDNTAATWGERTLGAAQGFDDVIYVGIGTGIGGGIVSGGHLNRGHHGFAGEIGHVTIDIHGERCVCGRRGCWELLASGTGLARLAGRPGEIVTEAGRAGDERALEVLGRFAHYIAVGLTDLIAILDPGCVVLGGGVFDPPDPLLGLVRASLTKNLGRVHVPDADESHRTMPEIRAAALGRRAGAIGAALLARDLGD